VAYDGDRGDPFDLESSAPVNDVPCEDEPDFGTQPLVSCDALRGYPHSLLAVPGRIIGGDMEADRVSRTSGCQPGWTPQHPGCTFISKPDIDRTSLRDVTGAERRRESA
jgi:hypothetical protein